MGLRRGLCFRVCRLNCRDWGVEGGIELHLKLVLGGAPRRGARPSEPWHSATWWWGARAARSPAIRMAPHRPTPWVAWPIRSSDRHPKHRYVEFTAEFPPRPRVVWLHWGIACRKMHGVGREGGGTHLARGLDCLLVVWAARTLWLGFRMANWNGQGGGECEWIVVRENLGVGWLDYSQKVITWRARWCLLCADIATDGVGTWICGFGD